MKYTQHHLGILKAGIDSVFDRARAKGICLVTAYEKGEFHNSDKVKDLQKRFCFDLLYMSGIKIGDGIGTGGHIIGDYTDDHTYTALKKVCPKVTKRY